MLEEGVIVCQNWEICGGNGLGDLLQAPTVDDVIEDYGGDYFWYDRILQNNSLTEWRSPWRNGQRSTPWWKTTNHAELLPGDHWGIEKFLGLGDDKILDVLHEVQLAEYVKVQHVIDPNVGQQSELRIPDIDKSWASLGQEGRPWSSKNIPEQAHCCRQPQSPHNGV